MSTETCLVEFQLVKEHTTGIRRVAFTVTTLFFWEIIQFRDIIVAQYCHGSYVCDE